MARLTQAQQMAKQTVERAGDVGTNIRMGAENPDPQYQTRDAGIRMVLAAISPLLYGDTYNALLDAAGYKQEQQPMGGWRIVPK